MEISSVSRTQRKSLRWAGFDYSAPGVYFITICTTSRRPLFAHVDDTGRLHPSPIGRSVSELWDDLPNRFPQVELIAFIAMPDHVHGVLAILPDAGAAKPPPTLGRIVSVLKSTTTHHTRALRASGGLSGPLWQQGFHDRVVRSDDELRQIEGYIQENPVRWASLRISSEHEESNDGLA